VITQPSQLLQLYYPVNRSIDSEKYIRNGTNATFKERESRIFLDELSEGCTKLNIRLVNLTTTSAICTSLTLLHTPRVFSYFHARGARVATQSHNFLIHLE
jgi:hypothetical protein